MTPLLLPVVALLLIAALIWWLLIRTEGVYLGQRVVIWLYDVYAKRYDGIVQHDTVEEHLHLAVPVMERLQPHTHPLVLDVATGTARIPLALCHHTRFEGHVIGLDLSRKMLSQAANKIADEHFTDYVTLLWADAARLPFDDDLFDVVTCTEALEFMPQPENAVLEMVRVLRPGGLLLTTLRINEPFMPGKLWTEPTMRRVLQETGIEAIRFDAWQYDYTKVWGQKRGESDFSGAMALDGVLRCPRCSGYLIQQTGAWVCDSCACSAPLAANGVIELVKAKCNSVSQPN